MRAAVALALSSALWSCAPPAPSPQVTSTCAADAGPTDGLPTASLGRQVDGPFQPLVDGDVMPVVHGPQGGQHVYVSVRLFTGTSGTWVYTFQALNESGFAVGSSTQTVLACGPGWTTSTYVRVLLDFAPASGSIVLSARPQGTAPDLDAGAGPLDQRVHVTFK
jgi:hypothetical protein